MNSSFKPILVLFLISFSLVSNIAHCQTYAKNGMVVSDNKTASKVGIDILKKGGNAIDASVATAFALAVTHPAAGNIGGGGFLVLMDSTGFATTIDFREKAPLSATSDMYLDDNGELISGSNHDGIKSIGVPGTVAGLYLAHKKYGKLAWKELVQPSIDLAKNGFPMTWALARDGQALDVESSPQFLRNYFKNKDGQLVKFEEIWKQEALGNTLMEIRDHGHDGFYKGKIAKEIAKFMKTENGLITENDLENYEAIERQPVRGSYEGYDILSMPPPSSGGVALIEMLNLAEQANLDTIPFNSTPYVHVIAEIMRRAFADRAEHLGDPDFNPNIPIKNLTSKAYAKSRFQNIDHTRASASEPSEFGQLYEGSHTTHFSVIDQEGTAVSLTYTIERSYGSGLGSPELGFIFNNEMGDFNPQPGFTNSFGLIGSKPNTIEPGKRMLSSMTPTIVAKNGKPYLIIGSPGGRTIINTVFQTVLNVLEYDMPIKKAIEAMKIHHQWLPNTLIYEKDLMSPDTKNTLEEMGHQLKSVRNLGVLMGIINSEESSIYIGASDSSSPDGGAIGY